MRESSRKALQKALDLVHDKRRAERALPAKERAKRRKKVVKRPKVNLAEINEELMELFPPKPLDPEAMKTVTVTADQIKFVNPHTFVELGATLRAVREKVQSWNGKTDHAWHLMNELREFFKKKEG